MIKVSTILARKGNSTVKVSPDTSVLDALKLMADKNIGSVVVADGDSYLGIVTERDYSRKVILMGKHSSDTTVKEIMSSNLPTLGPDDSIDYCMSLMSDKHIRYLPVFKSGALTGIISISDVVTQTILSQKETINALESYIKGN